MYAFFKQREHDNMTTAQCVGWGRRNHVSWSMDMQLLLFVRGAQDAGTRWFGCNIVDLAGKLARCLGFSVLTDLFFLGVVMAFPSVLSVGPYLCFLRLPVAHDCFMMAILYYWGVGQVLGRRRFAKRIDTFA